MILNMQNCYCLSASVRILFMMRNTRFVSNSIVQFSRAIKISRPCLSVCRVICTDSKLGAQSTPQPKHELAIVHETAYCLTPFLKENFNIVDNRYFKLISDTNENNLEELLRKEEFKEVLSRSSFTFDVNLSDFACNHNFISNQFSFISFEDINKNVSLKYLKKPEDFEEFTLCSKNQDKNNSGKPTEQQLLFVIDRLTFSLINFFEKPQDYSIYHKNVIFKNCIRGITTRGLPAYMQTMYILKIYGMFHYAKVKVEILKITHHIEDGTVRVRWRVNGVSRQQQIINIWKMKKFSRPLEGEEETEWLDGFSIFSVDSDGLIYKHVCDKLMPDSDEVKANKSGIKSKLLGLLGLSRRGPASLHAFLSYKSENLTYKRIT